MLDVRSRAGIMAVTTGAALLLALPVVAAGQVPNVGDVVGGVKDRVPAPPVSVPAPPVQLPPQASPPAPAPKAQNSPPPRSPSAQPPEAPPSSPPAHGRSKKPSASSGGGGGDQPGSPGDAPGASQGGGSGDGGSEDGDSKAGGDGGGTKGVSQEGGNVPTDVQIADQAAEAPVDASPSTLPFTGFQLALMVALGLAAVGTGFALRRGARSTG